MTRGGQNGTAGMSLVIPQEKIDQLTENSYYNVRMKNDNAKTAETATAGDGKGGGDVKGYNNFWIDPGSNTPRSMASTARPGSSSRRPAAFRAPPPTANSAGGARMVAARSPRARPTPARKCARWATAA